MPYVRDAEGKFFYFFSTEPSVSELDKAFVKMQPGGFETIGVDTTQFTFTEPKPPGAAAGLSFLAKDPTNPNRLWVQGLSFGQIGYTSDPAATWTITHAPLAGGNIHQMLFTPTHAWAVVGENSSKNGSIWRSPLPNPDGSGLAFVKKFDLATASGVPVNSFFRPRCLAVNGVHCYAVTYGTTVGDGGPCIYYSNDSGESWNKVFTWAQAKHAHAVRVINNVPLVMLGDGGFADAGLWRAPAPGATNFVKINQDQYSSGGNPFYGIDFMQGPPEMNNFLVTESDNPHNLGPLWLPSDGTTAVVKPFIPSFRLSLEDYGTNRCLIFASDGNMYFINTGEFGNLGPRDSLHVSQFPYNDAVRLHSWPSLSTAYQDAIEVGDYICAGPFFFRKVKFRNQLV